MTILFSDETDASLPFDPEETAKEVIRAALSEESFPFEAELSLTLTDDEGIREINKEYREIDKSTDVLSFPMLEYAAPGCFSDIGEGDKNPDTGEVMLGDIMISVDHLKAQAKEYGHSLKREFAFLIVHSVLHLLGYDHMEDDMRLEMEAHQKKILDENGFDRNVEDHEK